MIYLRGKACTSEKYKGKCGKAGRKKEIGQWWVVKDSGLNVITIDVWYEVEWKERQRARDKPACTVEMCRFVAFVMRS